MSGLELLIAWGVGATAVLAFMYGASGCSRAMTHADPGALASRGHARMSECKKISPRCPSGYGRAPQ